MHHGSGCAQRRDPTVEGVLDGYITDRPRGEEGFGYDPVFLVPEQGKTLAELGPTLKNSLSHRYKALQAMRPIILKLRDNILKHSTSLFRVLLRKLSKRFRKWGG